MKGLTVLAAAFTLVFAACGGQEPTDLELEQDQKSIKIGGEKWKLLKGEIVGNQVGFPGGPGGVCGQDFWSTSTGTGTVSHLGKSSWTYVECGKFIPPANLIAHGDFTATAANGDTLYGSYIGTVDFMTGAIDAKHKVTGGTGRFVGASGAIDGNGLYTFAQPGGPNPFNFVLLGIIAH